MSSTEEICGFIYRSGKNKGKNCTESPVTQKMGLDLCQKHSRTPIALISKILNEENLEIESLRCTAQSIKEKRKCRNPAKTNGYCTVHQKEAEGETKEENRKPAKKNRYCDKTIIKYRRCKLKAGSNGLCHIHKKKNN